MACGAANGEVDEGRRIVEEVLGGKKKADVNASTTSEAGTGSGDSSSDLVEIKKGDGSSSGEENATVEENEERTGSRLRQRRSGTKKKGSK
jgi:hypothetical protein